MQPRSFWREVRISLIEPIAIQSNSEISPTHFHVLNSLMSSSIGIAHTSTVISVHSPLRRTIMETIPLCEV